jgi:uncharacterized protein YabE (DUF348 family)
MNRLIHKSTVPFGALIFAVLFLIAMTVIVLSNVTHADNGNKPQSGRLITIHDRGTEKVILTQATTIGDALKEAGITIASKDAVEPSANQVLVASDYQVNIYRARPVIIIDGNTRTKVNTPYQTASQIAESIGIKLFDEDTTVLERTDDIIASGAGLQLTIKRATPFTFDLYGRTSVVRTQGKTVGEMLSEKGIELGKDDKVLPTQDTVLTEGLNVRVWREGKQTITVDEPINFEVEKINNVDQQVGYHQITTVGENGSRSVTYDVTVQNGQEVGRTEIASITTKQPVKQTEVIGVKGEYNTPSENETITWGFLMANGFTRQQAAGIMGNLMQEHGFNTSDTSGGYGLVQWTGGRRSELMSMPYPENIYTQLNFLMHELNTSYAGVQNDIKAYDSLENSVSVFQNKFERCGICMESQRIQFARNILASH